MLKDSLSTQSLISPSFQGGPTIFHKGNFLKHIPYIVSIIGCKIKKERQKKGWEGEGGAPMCHNMSPSTNYTNSLINTRSSLMGLPQVSLLNARELRE